MKKPSKTREAADDDQGSSLWDLIRRLAFPDGTPACRQMHEHRPIFHYRDRRELLLAQFLDQLRQGSEARWGEDVASYAYNLMIDKTLHFPPSQPAGKEPTDSPEGRAGSPKTDCRHYYRALWKRMNKVLAARGAQSELEREELAAQVIQSYMVHQFYLSLMEGRRRIGNPFLSRYFWNHDHRQGKRICLWMPKYLTGSRRRAWLQANVGRPDPEQPGERERIQALVNKRLIMPMFVAFDEREAAPANNPQDATGALATPQTHQLDNLGAVVAAEKATRIAEQRPAIQALGKLRLESLVLRIFFDIEQGDYDLGAVARDFGLSVASLSRFAGPRWTKKINMLSDNTIPDLFRNVAQVLVAHEAFIEATQAAGYWAHVRVLAQANASSRQEDHS